MSKTYSKDVEAFLRKAGWRPGRRKDLARWRELGMDPFPAARRILEEFGGLRIGSYGPGIDFARSDINLRPREYNRDFVPDVELEQVAGARLFPIGTTEGDSGDLWVDDSGRVFVEGSFPDGSVLKLQGESFAQALESILLGKGYKSELGGSP